MGACHWLLSVKHDTFIFFASGKRPELVPLSVCNPESLCVCVCLCVCVGIWPQKSPYQRSCVAFVEAMKFPQKAIRLSPLVVSMPHVQPLKHKVHPVSSHFPWVIICLASTAT